MQLTDEQAVKGRWPDACDGMGRVWTGPPWMYRRNLGVIQLGRDWQSARQHPSVVEWEQKRRLPTIEELEATIAEQADWIAVVEQQFTRKDDGEWVNLRADKLEEICHEQTARIEELEALMVRRHQKYIDSFVRAETANARVAELEAQVVNLMAKVEGVK